MSVVATFSAACFGSTAARLDFLALDAAEAKRLREWSLYSAGGKPRFRDSALDYDEHTATENSKTIIFQAAPLPE